MTEFYFVRHCESMANLQPELVGGYNPLSPASDRGKRQSTALGEYLRKINLRPDAVYSSGANRTLTTAQISLGVAGISTPIERDERLAELSQGDAEGRPRIEVYTPEVIERYRLTELSGALPGAESILDAQDRNSAFLFDRHEQFPDGTILVYRHGLAIRSLAGAIRGSTKQQILAEKTDNVSLTQITVKDGTPSVCYVGKNVINPVD